MFLSSIFCNAPKLHVSPQNPFLLKRLHFLQNIYNLCPQAETGKWPKSEHPKHFATQFLVHFVNNSNMNVSCVLFCIFNHSTIL
jgi:hypothetical protein